MPNLRVGDRAPEFFAITHRGEPISLRDFLGKRALILFFYPKDGTPLCTKEACSFRDSYEKFLAAGAEVIGISSDSNERHREFATKYELPFPLISDADGALRKLFGVSRTLGVLPGRVTYVIDRSGVVRLVFAAQFASDIHVRQALSVLSDNQWSGGGPQSNGVEQKVTETTEKNE
jgi:peroxiredoxin Q/BCP